MNRASRFFNLASSACSFLGDLLSGDPPLDPLDEDPHYVLTRGERASIRKRRDAVTDPLVRADMTHLLTAVEYLGRLREEDDETGRRFADVAPEHVEPARPDVFAWLAEPWPDALPFPENDNPLALVTTSPTRLEVLAALIGMNGGLAVKHVGLPRTEGGPYGRMGITLNEAITLVHMNAWIGGWVQATGMDPASLDSMLAKEVQRASAARVALMHPPDAVPTKTVTARATELYVDGKKVADVSNIQFRDIRQSEKPVCEHCHTAHFPRDCCQA